MNPACVVTMCSPVERPFCQDSFEDEESVDVPHFSGVRLNLRATGSRRGGFWERDTRYGIQVCLTGPLLHSRRLQHAAALSIPHLIWCPAFDSPHARRLPSVLNVGVYDSRLVRGAGWRGLNP